MSKTKATTSEAPVSEAKSTPAAEKTEAPVSIKVETVPKADTTAHFIANCNIDYKPNNGLGGDLPTYLL